MKSLLTLACATAMAVATSGALGQSTSGTPDGGASMPMKTKAPTPNDGTSRRPPGGSTTDSNKMGIAGPESPVDSKAPNAASCTAIKARAERDKCLARARQVEKERAATSGEPATRGATKP